MVNAKQNRNRIRDHLKADVIRYTGDKCPPPCGKGRFLTREEAKRFARTMYPDKKQRAYRCKQVTDGFDADQFWHLTSIATETVTKYREWEAPEPEPPVRTTAVAGMRKVHAAAARTG